MNKERIKKAIIREVQDTKQKADGVNIHNLKYGDVIEDQMGNQYRVVAFGDNHDQKEGYELVTEDAVGDKTISAKPVGRGGHMKSIKLSALRRYWTKVRSKSDTTEKSGEMRQLKRLKEDIRDWMDENEGIMRQAGVAEAYGGIIIAFNDAIEAVEYEKFPLSAMEDLTDALYEVKRGVDSPEFNEYMNRANNLLDDIDRSYGSAGEDRFGPYER